VPRGRLWNSKVLGAASTILIAAFVADMVSLELLRPRMAEPENGFVVAEGFRIGRHFFTFYVSHLDQLLEWTLVVASTTTLVASLNLQQRGR
jgi:hypothetical protein